MYNDPDSPRLKLEIYSKSKKNLIRYFEQFHRYCRDDLNFGRIEKLIHHLIMVKMNLTWTFTQFCGAVLACLCIIFLRDVSKVVFLYLFFLYSVLSLFDQHDLSDNLKPNRWKLGNWNGRWLWNAFKWYGK